jgi:putative transposase
MGPVPKYSYDFWRFAPIEPGCMNGNPVRRRSAMPRAPRFEIAGVPQHVVQRGIDRRPAFLDDEDRQSYLFLALHGSRFRGVDVNAYALMGNHVHLLITAPVGAISKFMHDLGSAYVARFNHRHGRTGSLWEGRFRSCLVDSERYLWNCHRYIEFNPVRAGLCEAPHAYAWSSYRANGLGKHDPLVRPRPEFFALADTTEARCEAYRHFVARAGEDEAFSLERLRKARTLGSAAFNAYVETTLGLEVEPRRRGRKAAAEPNISEPALFPQVS